jgi:hypothetical protein
MTSSPLVSGKKIVPPISSKNKKNLEFLLLLGNHELSSKIIPINYSIKLS